VHWTDASAYSRKVAWSSRPLAAVYSGIIRRRLRLARSLSEGTAASAESASASRPAHSPWKVLLRRRLGGGVRRSGSPAVPNVPAVPVNAGALPMLQEAPAGP
jgi:hypothetical protein